MKGSSGRERTAPSATGVLQKTNRVINEGGLDWFVEGGRVLIFFHFSFFPPACCRKAGVRRLHSPVMGLARSFQASTRYAQGAIHKFHNPS